MKWFKRLVVKWVHEDWNSPEESGLVSNKARGSSRLGVEGEDRPWGDGLRLNVKRVNGGSVVTFFRYDSKADRDDNRHYIITDDADFNAELSKLITMESMR